jgi:hypothetical protein
MRQHVRSCADGRPGLAAGAGELGTSEHVDAAVAAALKPTNKCAAVMLCVVRQK